MKKKNWLNRKWMGYIILGGILLCCLFYRLHFFKHGIHNVLYNSDSVTYFTSFNIFKGNIDLYRTPLYTIIIYLFDYLSRDHLFRNLILFQQALSFLSIIPFYYISYSTFRNRFIVILTVLLYGCHSLIINQNVNINPECLCIIGSTLLLYMFVRYIEKPTKYTAFFLGLFPFILIMLKPTYLIVLCIIFIFLIIRYFFFRKEKRELFWGLIGWFIAVTCVLSYCELNRRYNGEFVLSKVELNNSLSNIITSGTYKQGGDKELITLIDTTKQKGIYTSVFLINNGYMDNFKRCNDKFPTYLKPTGDMNFCLSIPNTINYSPERINKFVRKSQYSITYLKYLIRRIVNTLWDYKILFSIIILESAFILFAFVKCKKIVWTHLFCILFVIAQLTTIIIVVGQFSLDINAPIEAVKRLLLPSSPFIILIIASVINIFISSLDINKFYKLIKSDSQ